MASGNYLALKVTPAEEGATVQTVMIPGNKPPVTLDEELNVVYRIASNDQIIKFITTDSTGVHEQYLSLDLTLEEDDS